MPHWETTQLWSIQYSIPARDSIKDLGIINIIDDKLKFHAHTVSVIAKANCTLTVINKSFVVAYMHVHA